MEINVSVQYDGGFLPDIILQYSNMVLYGLGDAQKV